MSSSLWGWKGHLLLNIHGAEFPCPNDVMASFGSSQIVTATQTGWILNDPLIFTSSKKIASAQLFLLLFNGKGKQRYMRFLEMNMSRIDLYMNTKSQDKYNVSK